MDSPLISVIVPVYKVERYLNRCLDSILKQSYTNLEIILVDDGSPDNCAKICDKYAEIDARCHVIHKSNGGLPSARNAGLDIASGKYVVFVDSDDWLDTGYVHTLYNLINNNMCEMSACQFNMIKGNVSHHIKNINNEVKIITGNVKFWHALSQDSYAGFAWNKMFVNQIIRDNHLRFDERIFNGEDIMFIVQYLQFLNKVVVTNEKLYNYFFNESGITNSKFSIKAMTILIARENLLEFIRTHAPMYTDIVISGYLFHLIKFKYMLTPIKENEMERYTDVENKIQQYKNRILSLNGISIKVRIKLYLMVNFPSIFGWIYRRSR